jgi:acetaldehyde dehydrogenase
MSKTKVAVIGSGNIGTDLMFKIIRLSRTLEMAALAGIDPDSDGLARARRLGIATTADGVDGLVKLPGFGEIQIVFDATSAKAHLANAAVLAPLGKQLVDLTPAAIGPYTVPAVNLDQHLDAPNMNMVTCGGQATIPVVAAIARVTPVHYGEIVASIASKSSSPTWTPPRTPAPSTPPSNRPPAPRSACSSKSRAPLITCRPTPGTWTS